MRRSTIGWLWVAGQALLLGGLIVLPGRDDWPTPGWFSAVASVLFFGGLALIAVAAFGLGNALTPTPVPTEQGTLKTAGLYQFARHPIYTGVLAVVVGMTLRSGSWLHAVLAVIAVAFFDRKAAWEEKQLAQRFPDYSEYAKRTGKFLPFGPRRASKT